MNAATGRLQAAACTLPAQGPAHKFLCDLYFLGFRAISNPYGDRPHIGLETDRDRLQPERMRRQQNGAFPGFIHEQPGFQNNDGPYSRRGDCWLLRSLLGLYPCLRQALRRDAMTLDYILGGGVTVFLALYLTYALIRPERF